MGRRAVDAMWGKYPWLKQSSVWRGRKIGVFWKRKLSKARRKYIKLALRGIRGKEPVYYESTVNWKAS